jgi:hypothetical protein
VGIASLAGEWRGDMMGAGLSMTLAVVGGGLAGQGQLSTPDGVLYATLQGQIDPSTQLLSLLDVDSGGVFQLQASADGRQLNGTFNDSWGNVRLVRLSR